MAKEMSPVFMIQAKQLFDAGKFSAAIMTLQEGLKQYPQFMSARVLLGEVHWTAGEVTLARTELEYVINSVPDNFAAHRKLALIYREAGEVQLAMKSCRNVLQANPRDLEMRTLLDQLQELPAPVSQPPKAEPPSPDPHLPTLHDLPPPSVLRPPHLVMASAAEPATMAPKEPESIDSETLAELYILQGHHDKGLVVYHRLAAKYPQNKQYRDRIEALERPEAVDAARPSESASAALTLPQEAPSAGKVGQRKNQVRRLEGWLQVVRARRRL
jgi:tetratricopeptide (TPR) repeat protein